MGSNERRSPLGVVILAALAEQPMHAYRIHSLIRSRGKDRVVNVRGRASIYQSIERLRRLGLIAVRESDRVDRRPERTVYEITEAGRETTKSWLREMIVDTENEFPEFLVAVSFLASLTPTEAREQLALRAEARQALLAQVRAELAAATEVPRLFLLEEELRVVTVEAELGWLRSVITDLESGRLTWDDVWLREIAARFDHQLDSSED